MKTTFLMLCLATLSLATMAQEKEKNVNVNQNTIDSKEQTIENAKEYRIEKANSMTVEKQVIFLDGDVLIRTPNGETGFNLIKASSAICDKEKNSITAIHGSLESYKVANLNPETVTFDTLNYNTISKMVTIKNIQRIN